MNIRDNNNNTPLHLAAKHNSKWSIELLLKYNANVYLRNNNH